jgi:phenylalanyl-tRNA synthetase alpha chain
MITYTTIERDQFNLTQEGKEIADSGSHEAKVFNAVDPVNGIAIAELAVRNLYPWKSAYSVHPDNGF